MAADLASAVLSVHILKHLNEIFGAARAVGDVQGDLREGGGWRPGVDYLSSIRTGWKVISR